MRAKQRGFTLIELMIVVAIIGVLAAIAIPAYQTYTIRAQVSEGASLVSGLETAFSGYYASTGTAAATNSAVGITAAISGTYVSDVKLTAPGQITVTYGPSANAKILNATLTYTAYQSANGDIAWVCNDGTAAQKAITGPPVLTVVTGGTTAAAATGAFATTPSYLPTVCQ